MVKREIDAEILKQIEEYIAIISKHYKIDAVYLFGSYAKGNTHKWSDVDLAIVSSDVKDRISDMAKMFVLAKNIEVNIEPHPYNTKVFNANEYIIVDEILRTGIRVA